MSDESPYDRVWSTDSSNAQPREVIKNPPKVMVWYIMGYRGLS